MMKIYVSLGLFAIMLILTGCGYGHIEYVAPNDDISEEICSNTKDVCKYLGREQNYEDALVYSYYIGGNLSSENIALMINTITSMQESCDGKVCIDITAWIPGGIGGLCSVSNYYLLPDGTYYMYPELCVYTIIWQDLTTREALDPNTFIGAEGIKYLRIDERMNEKAKELGIDWYEIWPDLEGIEVIPAPGQ